jgi:hypothetical protein
MGGSVEPPPLPRSSIDVSSDPKSVPLAVPARAPRPGNPELPPTG